MKQKEKKKKSNFWVLLAVVTSVIKLFDSEDGLFTVIFIVIVGIIFWGIGKLVKTANKNNQAQQSEQQGYQNDAPSPAAQFSRQKAQDFNARANHHSRVQNQQVYRPNELNGRMQELKDLLEAGIIDRAEYNDRITDIQAKMR
ncbi:MAG: hypothetical protein K0S22_1201 [Oscillospiraceae bacterium]|jgi:hypothetical protein|nr:hypothetical protein [Oscillospiraceae bacterium]